jgi:hypothetical protein
LRERAEEKLEEWVNGGESQLSVSDKSSIRTIQCQDHPGSVSDKSSIKTIQTGAGFDKEVLDVREASLCGD